MILPRTLRRSKSSCRSEINPLQTVLTPCLLGAEPNYADVTPFGGTQLSEDEESAGLARTGPTGDIIASNRDMVFCAISNHGADDVCGKSRGLEC